jgi:ankyrin repeat protein
LHKRLQAAKLIPPLKTVKVLSLSVTPGMNPLHVACIAGQVNVLKVLLNSKKVSPNSRSDSGYFPLHFAVESSNPEVIRGLRFLTI